MKAIVYTTNTGSTEHYAKLLAQETELLRIHLPKQKKSYQAELISFAH